MKVKRTFAPDIRQAMRRVREEQGADAVILGNRKVDGGVEIISAVDYDEDVFYQAIERTADLLDRLTVAGLVRTDILCGGMPGER